MKTFHQIFTTVIAALIFFILIVKFASTTVNNGDRNLSKPNKVEKTSTKRKSKKKVRFAANHDEFVINNTISKPLQTESVVLGQNRSEIESVELMCDDGIDELVKEKEGLISEEDDSDEDWEGVERSELQKLFAVAADYGKMERNLRDLDKDVEMELYGLYKVATEGPCNERQPMAFRVSARAKWNAWQKLGNMNPDAAMEQYITLLSEKVPRWFQGNPDDYVDEK